MSAEKRPAQESSLQSEQAEAPVRIRPTEGRPSADEVNATLKRLGIEVEWTEEAVRQLLDAAAAADEYLRAFPDQAGTLASEPASALREMADKGFLSGSTDALLSALESTRAKGSKLEGRGISIRLRDLVFDDSRLDRG